MNRVGARVQGLPHEAPRPEIRGLDGAATRELQEIYRETDSELMAEDLLGFALRLEQSDKIEAAAGVYTALLEGSHPDPIQHRARLQLDALYGRGSIGARAEILLRQFSRQATDPRTIIPMMIGSVAFGLTRNLALGRLLGSGQASLLTRGWGARLGAGLLGFCVEVPVFVGAARALGGGHRSLDKDLLGAGLTLGALKSFSLLGREASAFAFRSPLKPIARVLPEVSMFSGLLAAHSLEAQLGLRPQVDGAGLLTETLAAYFSLGVGGRLGHALLGRRYATFSNELTLRAEQSGAPILQRLAAAAPAGKSLARFLPLPAPGPMMIFMSGTQFERLFRWLEKRLYPTEERWEYQPSKLSHGRMEGTMRVLLRRFPKLRKVLSRTPWTVEQKWALLKAVTPNSNREPWEIFHHLPEALIAMEGEAWPFEQQLALLQLLSRIAEFPIPIHKYLPHALTAMRDSHWSGDMKFQLLYHLAEQGGPNADRVYSNLPLALKAMRESRWDFDQQFALLEQLARYGEHKVGSVLSHLPTALAFMENHEWTFAQQARLLILIADRARDNLEISWMMEDHLPTNLGMMDEFAWTTSMQCALLTRLLERAQAQSVVAMEYLPGLLDTMKKFEWRSEYVYDTLGEILERGGPESGKVIEITPILLQTMRHKGFAKPTQRDLLAELAGSAAGWSKLAILQFAMALVNKPLHWKFN